MRGYRTQESTVSADGGIGFLTGRTGLAGTKIPAYALILSGAAMTVVLPRAAAAAVIPTRLVISVSPLLVSYPNPQLTITGTLKTFPTNGQSAQPVADETVALSLLSENGYLSKPLGSAVTDANG
jgi:hypothetical protein